MFIFALGTTNHVASPALVHPIRLRIKTISSRKTPSAALWWAPIISQNPWLIPPFIHPPTRNEALLHHQHCLSWALIKSQTQCWVLPMLELHLSSSLEVGSVIIPDYRQVKRSAHTAGRRWTPEPRIQAQHKFRTVTFFNCQELCSEPGMQWSRKRAFLIRAPHSHQ